MARNEILNAVVKCILSIKPEDRAEVDIRFIGNDSMGDLLAKYGRQAILNALQDLENRNCLTQLQKRFYDDEAFDGLLSTPILLHDSIYSFNAVTMDD